MFRNQEVTFNKYDDNLFVAKYLQRFGACTLSLLVAQTIFYPFDTVKRCLQLNGSTAHKNPYSGSTRDCLSQLFKDQGIRGLYQGFSVNLCRCAPLATV